MSVALISSTNVRNKTHRPTPVAERYGMLKVLMHIPRQGWLCKCDCGNEKFIDGNHLRNFKYLSCGCTSRRRQAEALKLTLKKKKEVKKVAPKQVRRYRTGTPCWVCRNKIGEVAEAAVVLCKICERGCI